MQKAVTFTFK